MASQQDEFDKHVGALTFVINPETKDASLDLFLKSIEDISRVIKQVDFAITRERSKRKWVITRLQASSPTVTIQPLVAGETLGVVVEGLRLLSDRDLSEPPPHFTTDVLNDVKKMRRLFRGKDKARNLSFRVNGSEIASVDSHISESVDRIFRASYDVLGSLEGTLDAVNLHGTTSASFTIWERISGHPVKCVFRKELWSEKVKDLLERRVLVAGKVRYFSNGRPALVRDIIDIEDQTRITSSNESDFGSVPELTSGQDPQVYLERIRQQW